MVVDVHPLDGGSSIKAVVYTGRNTHQHRVCTACHAGTTDNPAYSAFHESPPHFEEVAKLIHDACGPSGPNRDYLYNLADFLRGVGVDDAHVFELEQRVRAAEAAGGSQ